MMQFCWWNVEIFRDWNPLMDLALQQKN